MADKTMLGKMLVMAANAHGGQFDRGGHPYFLHVLAVMNFIHEVNTDEELLCIALGHDIIEDTSVTYKDLRDAGFSERVIDGIRALTKVKGQTYEEYKLAVFANHDAIVVKMADIRHNTDLRRLKGVSEKDLVRVVKYNKFYEELKSLRTDLNY